MEKEPRQKPQDADLAHQRYEDQQELRRIQAERAKEGLLPGQKRASRREVLGLMAGVGAALVAGLAIEGHEKEKKIQLEQLRSELANEERLQKENRNETKIERLKRKVESLEKELKLKKEK